MTVLGVVGIAAGWLAVSTLVGLLLGGALRRLDRTPDYARGHGWAWDASTDLAGVSFDYPGR